MKSHEKDLSHILSKSECKVATSKGGGWIGGTGNININWK